jgi:hypothetical protein
LEWLFEHKEEQEAVDGSSSDEPSTSNAPLPSLFLPRPWSREDARRPFRRILRRRSSRFPLANTNSHSERARSGTRNRDCNTRQRYYARVDRFRTQEVIQDSGFD